MTNQSSNSNFFAPLITCVDELLRQDDERFNDESDMIPMQSLLNYNYTVNNDVNTCNVSSNTHFQDTFLELETGNAKTFNCSSLKFLNYNVRGLPAIMDNAAFVMYVEAFDIVCITETHMKHDNINFPSFNAYTADAHKLSKHGRLAGGSYGTY